MQNDKFKMQNDGITFGDDLKSVGVADTSILHSVF